MARERLKRWHGGVVGAVLGGLVPVSVAAATTWFVAPSVWADCFAKSVFAWLSCPAGLVFQGAVDAGWLSHHDARAFFALLCANWAAMGLVVGLILHRVIFRKKAMTRQADHRVGNPISERVLPAPSSEPGRNTAPRGPVRWHGGIRGAVLGALVPLSVAAMTQWIWVMNTSARCDSFGRSVFFWLSCPAFGLYEGAVLLGLADREAPAFLLVALCLYWVVLGFLAGAVLARMVRRLIRAKKTDSAAAEGA